MNYSGGKSIDNNFASGYDRITFCRSLYQSYKKYIFLEIKSLFHTF